MIKILGRVCRLAAIGGLIGGVGATVGCKKSAEAATPQRPPPIVDVAPAISHDVPVYLDEIGKAVAFQSVTIMPQVAGRVDEIHFNDGDDLEVGKLLFKIDPRPFAATLDQAKAQLLKDQATASNADAWLRRQSDIYKQGFVAPSDYDTALFNAKAAAAAVEADKASIEAARLNVEYCTILSPIQGRAGMRLVDPGNIVKINETPLLLIQRLDPIYADFTINERDLPAVRAHMADHTLHAMATLPTDSVDDGREGDLTFLDNTVGDASGTIRLRATLKNPDRHFWPGQFVNVRLVLLTQKDAVLVPLAAPQLGQKGSYVYVINSEQKAELRPVVLGQQHLIGPKKQSFVVIEDGVKAGERVVVNGQLVLFPGASVKVEPGDVGSAVDSVVPALAPTTSATAPAPSTTAPATSPAAGGPL